MHRHIGLATALLWGAFLAGGCGDSGTGTNNTNDNTNLNNNAGVCGDGVQDDGEECDDGAANSDTDPDACRANCRLPWCGDGVQDEGEACDDGNDSNQDGCLSAATDATDLCVPNVCGDGFVNTSTTGDGSQVEVCDNGVNDGTHCSPDCQQDLDRCGNSTVEQGEDCDDGQQNSDTTPNACRTDCHLPACGDGVYDDGTEECDNGANNGVSPSACMTDCTVTQCGDGYVGGSEQCDDGAANSDTAADACRSSCLTPTCGDGVIDTDEECDDGGGNSDTDPNACRTTCESPTCGDGVIDAGEVCDDGDQNGITACRVDCTLESCGDGVLDTGEQCDNGTSNSDTTPDACRENCVDPWCGDDVHDSGEACDHGSDNGVSPDACKSDCTVTTCGDGYLGGSEECDGSHFGTATCVTEGHAGGTLSCTGGCVIDDSGCFDHGDAVCELDKGETFDSNFPEDCGFLSIDGGQNHTCAVRRDGSVACWGRNLHGQLGDGTHTLRNRPWPVSLPAGVQVGTDPPPTIATGAAFSCVLREPASGNELRCWGYNNYGQLGTGDKVDSDVPVRSVQSLGDLSYVDAGFAHACVIPKSSPLAPQVRCWGRNNRGQLGDATKTDREDPVKVDYAGYGVTGLALGFYHTCAGLGSSGAVYCWGSNSDYQVGNNSTTDVQSPVAITLNGFNGSITSAHGLGGYFTMMSGGGWEWGSNDYYQLRFSTLQDYVAPVAIFGGSYDQLEQGGFHACGVKNGRVYCWGRNDFGQLGDNSTTDSYTPVEVMTLNTNESVTLGLGHKHSCIIRGDGRVQCWGKNSYGQVGIGSATSAGVLTPQDVIMP